MRESARMCASVRVALVFSSVKVSRRHHQKVFKRERKEDGEVTNYMA